MSENERDEVAKDPHKHSHHHHHRSHRHRHDHASDDPNPGHHKHRRNRRHHRKKSNEQKPCIAATPQQIGNTQAGDDEMNKTPVALETIDDYECPPLPSSFLEAQYESPHTKSDASIPVVYSQPNAQGDSVGANDHGHNEKEKLVNSSFWRSFANRINNRSRQVNNTHVRNHEAVPDDILENNEDETMVGHGNSVSISQTNNYVIPVATLVEEDVDATHTTPFKRKLFTITISFIIAIGVGVGVAASAASRDTANLDGHGNNTRGNTISPEQIPAMHNYTVWFRPNQYGGRAYYYGATCNALGFACSKCGVYEVKIDSNEVTGSCSNCNICSDDKGFEADCTNLGSGIFNCNYLSKVQHIPKDIGYNYTLWYCPYETGNRAMCMAYADCNLFGTACTKCGMYEVQKDTNEVIGACSSCHVCAGGGIDADCTNIGHGIFNCYYPTNE